MSVASIQGAQAPRSIWNARWSRFMRHRLAVAATIFLEARGVACAGADGGGGEGLPRGSGSRARGGGVGWREGVEGMRLAAWERSE